MSHETSTADLLVCPECAAGKHANCDGTAWDPTEDRPTTCECPTCGPDSGNVPADPPAREAKAAPASLYAAALVAISEWVDQGNAHRDPEAQTWGRLAKITEEAGEVVAAYIGATGQNPRKGVVNTMDDVVQELLDVALAALAAAEHIQGHRGDVLQQLDRKIVAVAMRAGVVR